MKAKLVKESLYPKKKYGNKPNAKSWKILEFIKSKGKRGASLQEIQHYIWVFLDQKPPEDFWKKDDYTWSKKRSSRGHWATALYGSGAYPGLLHKYCKKNEKGKWVLVRMPNPGENIYGSFNFDE